MEVFAVTMTLRMGALATVIGFALVGFAPIASAQKAPEAPAAPAAAKTVKPTAKAASPCKGLDEAACTKSGETCSWIAATTRKDGKAVKAYCRKKGGFLTNKKAAPAKAATPATPAEPAKPATKKTTKATKPAAAAAAPAKPAEPAAETAKKATTKKVTPPPAKAN